MTVRDMPRTNHRKNGAAAGLGEGTPLLAAGESQLVVIDVQSQLADAMPAVGRARLEGAFRLLAAATEALGVPTTITEHVPDAIGPTAPWLRTLFPDATVIEKLHFDATAASGFVEHLGRFDRPDIVIGGMEAHICVLQAALGLAAQGWRVHLAVDAALSRAALDEETAWRRASAHGVELVTSEMVAFEWLRRADHPARRDVINAVKAKDALTRAQAPDAPP